MPKFILINGKKRSGKDYFAAELQNELLKHNFSSIILSFADPIKDIISRTLEISRQDLDRYKNDIDCYGLAIQSYEGGDIDDIQYIDFRTLLQNFGTEAMKYHFGDDVWVTLLQNKAKKQNVDYIIIPDFRFLCEEIDNSITVKIINNDIKHTDQHKSENELNDFKFNYIIDNTGYKDITDDIEKFVSLITMF